MPDPICPSSFPNDGSRHDPCFQEFTCGLNLRNVFERIFGYQEKRAGIEIKVKKIQGLPEIAELIPFPALAALARFQDYASLSKVQCEGILKSMVSFVNTQR